VYTAYTVHGRVHSPFTVRVRRCTRPFTAVEDRVHGPCTWPVHGRVHGPYTTVNGRVRTWLYGSCRRSCSSHARLYMRVLNTVVVHGSRLRPVYTSAYRVHGRPHTGREHVRVNGPCTRVHGHVYGHGHVLGPYTGHVHGGERPVNTGTVYTAVFTAGVTAVEGRYTARPCTRPCSGHIRPCMYTGLKHGRCTGPTLWSVYTAAYRVHSCLQPVYFTAVYEPCAWPCTGHVRGLIVVDVFSFACCLLLNDR